MAGDALLLCDGFYIHHFYLYKCTKHQFIHLLTAAFKDLHIENSKNYKRRYCPHHTDCSEGQSG